MQKEAIKEEVFKRKLKELANLTKEVTKMAIDIATEKISAPKRKS